MLQQFGLTNSIFLKVSQFSTNSSLLRLIPNSLVHESNLALLSASAEPQIRKTLKDLYIAACCVYPLSNPAIAVVASPSCAFICVQSNLAISLISVNCQIVKDKPSSLSSLGPRFSAHEARMDPNSLAMPRALDSSVRTSDPIGSLPSTPFSSSSVARVESGLWLPSPL